MTEPIIEIKNLSKEYIISHNVQSYYTLRDFLIQVVKKPFAYFSSKNSAVKKEKFLALNDINLSVMPGEVVGIIGRNGAGKSTLLKILSQITPPTKGSVHLRGRVASLLEVGTGFHPELTGRENIFLNGAILGMTQKEIKRKFNEIVDFAGIEKFLDTPVKRYSSGMYVRLAFAVASHLEPEILIVDEVLAVGDAEFQKKCLGKMGDITKKDGRTVLFVSHNMEAIKSLCSRCILLDKGVKIYEGDVEKTILEYGNLQSSRDIKINKGEYNANRRGSGTLSFTNIEILDGDDKKRNIFNIGETVRFKMSYVVYEKMEGIHISVGFFSSKARDLLLTDMPYEVRSGTCEKGESGTAIIEVNLTTIRPGEYGLYFWLGDKKATHQGSPVNYDVVDNMTEPLIINAKNEREKEMSGYFTLSSNIDIL
jgi:lipopolysaccharide transport system ATP-binding protein